MIYSIIPQEIIFANNEVETEKERSIIEYMGEKIEVSMLENNQYLIQRIISTSPKAFLNQNLQPGSIIKK